MRVGRLKSNKKKDPKLGSLSREGVIDVAGLFIYQSMSGDSSESTDYFFATDCTLEVKNSGVPFFFITNITAEISLNNNAFTQTSSSDYLFVCEETDQWGNTGSNGGKATVSLTNQDLSGYTAFVGDSIDSLNLSATDNSSTSISVTSGTW